MSTHIISGRAWVYGDDVNTDVIFPGKYTYTITDVREFAKHALEDLDPDFARQVQPDDIIVGGKNFGCGSSREQAAVCLKMSGVRVIIAKSFARIFFRNCVNNGVLPIVCPLAVEAIQKGDPVRVDLDAHTISTPRGTFTFPPLSSSVMEIIAAGGLIPMLRRKLGTEHLPMPEISFGGKD
ncbi:MAG: 3-isopropylmalate dehydratase small subunit [Anaerolineae bacterium]|nr:3-isopropylmalate dehydratase small subunit [Thermoflexales bacterium]MDW8407609.1 3-isopropylmalate dehydratase small subunit [Anaerolineae bacterium]